MNSKRDRPLNIAILLNSYRSPFITEIRDSYIRTIGAVSHDASLSFFYPAEKPDDFPDPEKFDLIVIGGSNTDPRKKHQWILRVHSFILDVVAKHPGKKLCGICWGHQTISMLFGAKVVDMEVPEVRNANTALPLPLAQSHQANLPKSWESPRRSSLQQGGASSRGIPAAECFSFNNTIAEQLAHRQKVSQSWCMGTSPS
jgi:anthranilate/para-aminobenzoate synthase component II